MRGLLMLLLSPCACLAADTVQQFAFGLPLELSGDEALYEVEIPASVYQGAVQPGLADLRVFNGAGEAVPFAFEPRPQPKTNKPDPVALNYFPLYGEATKDLEGLNLRVEKGRSGTVVSVSNDQRKPAAKRALLAYLVDASALRQAYQSIELDWLQQSASLATNLQVEASSDLKNWTTIVARAPLVRADFGGQRLEQRTIEFAPQTGKYLRLSWPGYTSAAGVRADQPIELTKVSVRTAEISIEPQRNWREVIATEGEKPGEYLFDLGGQFPVERLRIGLPQENSIAAIELLSRQSSKQTWHLAGATVVYRLARQGQQVVNPDLAVATTSDRYWLLRVDQKGGGVGSGLPRLTVGWVPRKLIFAARGSAPFQIAYGSATAEQAALAVESMVPGWRSDAQVKLAHAETLPERLLGGTAALARRPDYKVWTLWAALGLGVALLGWMAWKLVKQMQTPSQQDS